MIENYKISNSIIIGQNKILLDGEAVFAEEQDVQLPDFLKNAYRNFEIKEPKFFKMDLLCKLAFLSAELLLQKNNIAEKYVKDEIAVILSGASSCLNIDLKHYDSIVDKENYFPSPAVFVYTLPNIMLGEICIRHKITGENIYFNSQKFSPELLHSYGIAILDEKKASALILGWVEVNLAGTVFESFVCLVENDHSINNNNFVNFETYNLNKLYQNLEKMKWTS